MRPLLSAAVLLCTLAVGCKHPEITAVSLSPCGSDEREGIPFYLPKPLLIGAKDVAFPRLNLFSYYLYLTGAIFMLIVLATGGLDTGWTFYTPYSTQTSTNVIAATFGVFLLGFSSIFTGLNFLVTIHKMRAPSMTWYKMPLFLWAIYATGISQVLATPVIGITMLLLIFERVAGIGIFDPALGGDPVLFQHFFWFYSHPAVYIMILPAMGVISEIIPVFSRKHIFGYKFIAFSSVAIALFGFLVWGHHMFTSGQSELVNVIFSALTFTVSIPSAIKIFNWLMTMYRGSISFKTPMLYALSFIFIFTIGGLTGLFLGALAASVHLHDTYFVVAHFHYVMMGSAMFGFFAGIHYWWPKMTGRMYNEFWGLMAWLCIFIGFNGAFLPQFVMGSQGMPRRYFNYIEQFQGMHVSSTFFSYIMGIGFVIMAVYLAYSLFRGKIAPKNPWGGATLEWTTSSPPIHENFKEIPYAGDPYDYSDLEYDEENDCYVKKEPSVATAG
ncbi:cbb3-type cytochrome c oxidase subunit I [bacterium]|nr:cbb3-type cytochrome c oxidase subunit I [bacterium]